MSNATRGWVYFMGAEGSDLTKIGFSTRPKARLSQVQSGNPERLRILYAVPATKDVEAYLHNVLEPVRTVGEWFRNAPVVRLVGEQLLALHLARSMKSLDIDFWPEDDETEAELFRRARARKVAKADLEAALILATGA